jgi:hypothetical protein
VSLRTIFNDLHATACLRCRRTKTAECIACGEPCCSCSGPYCETCMMLLAEADAHEKSDRRFVE